MARQSARAAGWQYHHSAPLNRARRRIIQLAAKRHSWHTIAPARRAHQAKQFSHHQAYVSPETSRLSIAPASYCFNAAVSLASSAATRASTKATRAVCSGNNLGTVAVGIVQDRVEYHQGRGFVGRVIIAAVDIVLARPANYQAASVLYAQGGAAAIAVTGQGLVAGDVVAKTHPAAKVWGDLITSQAHFF